jgi:hypothetical protein
MVGNVLLKEWIKMGIDAKLNGKVKLPVKLKCINCETEFDGTPYDVLTNRNCCSKECTNKFKKGKNYHKIIGKNNCLYCNKEFNVYDNVPEQKRILRIYKKIN